MVPTIHIPKEFWFCSSPQVFLCFLFAGCCVVVSHDRWFLNRVCTHIMAFEGDGCVTFFSGNYEEYETHKRIQQSSPQLMTPWVSPSFLFLVVVVACLCSQDRKRTWSFDKENAVSLLWEGRDLENVTQFFVQIARIFLLREIFSPNKTKLKETQTSSNHQRKKEKSVNFLPIVFGWKTFCFCFVRDFCHKYWIKIKRVIRKLCKMTTLPNQTNLPHLPVPPLHTTLSRYLSSIKPLVLHHEYEHVNKTNCDFLSSVFVMPSLCTKTEQIKSLVDQFLVSEKAQKLYDALQERAQVIFGKKQNKPIIGNVCSKASFSQEHDNWLEVWWDDSYYCERGPITITTNPSIILDDLPILQSIPAPHAQLFRTAQLIHANMCFLKELYNNILPQNPAVCISQYNRVFGVCRIPNEGRDRLVNSVGYIKHLPTQHYLMEVEPKDPNYVIVMAKGHFFKVNALTSSGDPLPVQDLLQQVKHSHTLEKRLDCNRTVRVWNTGGGGARNGWENGGSQERLDWCVDSCRSRHVTQSSQFYLSSSHINKNSLKVCLLVFFFPLGIKIVASVQ